METVLDSNSFFSPSLDRDAIHRRILELEKGKVGLYSVGLYPASLAYNCAMQKNSEGHLLLAPRPGRDLLGAFPDDVIDGMDEVHVATIEAMATHELAGKRVTNSLADLLMRCELVILSANSNHVEDDLREACRLRAELNREQVVIACLAGSLSLIHISSPRDGLLSRMPSSA